MPTRNVVPSGRCRNASHGLRECSCPLEACEERAAARPKELQEAVRVGVADLAQGRYRDFESFDDLADYLHDLSDGRSGQAGH